MMHDIAPKVLSFEGFTLDLLRCALLRGEDEIALRPKAFDVLRYLAERPDRLITKEELIQAAWPGIAVTDDSLVQCVGEIRDALNDDDRRIVRTVPRRGYMLIADRLRSGSSRGSYDGLRARNQHTRPPQEVSFCRTADGVHLAVAQCGSGMPVIKIGSWLTHVEDDWQSPVWSPLLLTLAQRFRLIRYDPRGCGLSSQPVSDLSFEAMVSDLDAVVEAFALEHYALLGISRGAPVAIAHAARHPDRVERLVVHGGYPLGRRKRGDQAEAATQDALVTLMQRKWDPALARLVTTRFLPDATEEETGWLNELQGATTSSEEQFRVRTATGDLDVTELLPQVVAPTLVMHSRGDGGVPFEMGLMIARGIPNARFVALDSRNHLILSHEPAWPHFTRVMCGFLADESQRGAVVERSS